jgi:hypothetical protein
MKLILTVLLFTCGFAVAGNIPSETPVSVTGKLSLDKDRVVYITSNDSVVPGKADSRQHGTVPMRHIPIDSNDYKTNGPQLKEFQRYAELRKEAAEGKTVTLQGHFKSLTSKGEQAWGCPIVFEMVEGGG